MLTKEYDTFSVNFFPDIDECESDRFCGCNSSKNEKCINTEGSCNCGCAKGFSLERIDCVGMYYCFLRSLDICGYIPCKKNFEGSVDFVKNRFNNFLLEQYQPKRLLVFA